MWSQVKKPRNRVATADAVERRPARMRRHAKRQRREARGSKRRSQHTGGAAPSSPIEKRRRTQSRTSPPPNPAKPQAPPPATIPQTARYIGCYTSEDAFGRLRVYGGGDVGTRFALARHHAASRGKRFFAIARERDPAFGHAFAFDKPLRGYVCRSMALLLLLLLPWVRYVPVIVQA